MATATKKGPSPSPRASTPSEPGGPRVPGGVLAVFDGIYRFLASLKLAVFSLGTLAAVLGYATFFESWHGTAAVQEWIYQTKGFAILLAFLGTNILCAALIRYPWKRRQTGFVITHAGLLILLAGSFYSVKTSDEGNVGLVAGQEGSQLVRNDYPIIRVRPIDAATQKPSGVEYMLPFRPGTFGWGPGNPRPKGWLAELFHTATIHAFENTDPSEILTQKGDPFTFTVKSHLPASAWTTSHVADPSGIPMVKIRLQIKAPGMAKAMDAIDNETQRWLTPHSEELVPIFKRLYRMVKTQGPAQFVFNYVDRPELVEDFLNPPKKPGSLGVARLRYRDRGGKPRMFEWALEGEKGKTKTLPDSDLNVKFEGVAEIPAQLGRLLGESDIPVAHFKIREGDGPAADYYGWAMMPMVPSLIPSKDTEAVKHEQPLAEINYYLPPWLDPSTGRRGVIEILGTSDGKLYYRVFGRGDKEQVEIRAVGPLKRGKDVIAFGGNANMPMTISFQVEEYLTAGREDMVCEQIVLPKGQQGNGLAASLVAMSVKDDDGKTHTKEFWIRRPPAEPDPIRVSFPSGDYEVDYDVDRKPLGFSVKLDNFKVEFDPGTEQPSSFTSNVRLTDESMGINDEKHVIWMNHTMTHRGYTFYQASYRKMEDPRTGRPNGQLQSIFQVGLNPGRRIIYSGCIMVVLGAFVQFYMRAGIFTDGGKRERTLAEAKERKKASANGTAAPGGTVADVTESEEPL